FDRLTTDGIRVDSIADAHKLIETWEKQRDDDEAHEQKHKEENEAIAAGQQDDLIDEPSSLSNAQGGVQ
ncbi:MAG: hypothetical protein IJV62_04100, partial [Eggerthellaceae bacterium]|nr:hypothetical protein [Eggerthellaceae bacterium]